MLVKHGYVFTNREVFDRYLDTEEFRQRVKRFKADAIECYYPKHTREKQKFYFRLTEKYHLHQTAAAISTARK